MTMEEYGDYAITTMFLRGGPQPKPARCWDGKNRTWFDGWRISEKGMAFVPELWSCRSKREAAIRYCWRHGLIRRGRKKYNWQKADFSRIADTQA